MAARRSPQSILAEVGATLASSLTREGIHTIARQICEAMDVFSCDIWEYEPGARRVTFMATWCTAEENPYGDSVGDTAELDDWESMRTVVEDRQTVELHGDDHDLPLTDRASFEKWGFQTTIDTPLVYDDRVIGVLGLVEVLNPTLHLVHIAPALPMAAVDRRHMPRAFAVGFVADAVPLAQIPQIPR